MMKETHEAENARRVARTLGLGAFGFMCVVSAVVFFTEDDLGVFDYLLMVAGPFALGALAYFVGLHHDPEASD